MKETPLIWNLQDVVDKLSDPTSYQGLFHQHTEDVSIPSGIGLNRIVELTRSILFPGYFGHSTLCSQTLPYHIGMAVEELYELLAQEIQSGLCFVEHEQGKSAGSCRKRAKELATKMIDRLPMLRKILATDVQATYEGDPAAISVGEVICCYPVIRALSNYRLAHELYKLGIPLIPRMLTEMAHSETGIDIHPGAQIGEYFSIDHGTGVVIGATCIIGNHVKLYQGVTLGAKRFLKDETGLPIKGIARHPIIEDDVVIYSNATILGRITIGKGAVIGGNIWVTTDVPAGEKIVQGQILEGRR